MALQSESGLSAPGNRELRQQPGESRTRAAFPCGACLPTPSRRRACVCLSPGMFVRVRLPIGQPHPAILVIDRAIGSDQGLKFVYVVDAKNNVQYRRVIDRRAPGGRSAGDHRGAEAGGMGGRRRLAAGPPADAGQAGTDADALLWPSRTTSGGERRERGHEVASSTPCSRRPAGQARQWHRKLPAQAGAK